MLEQTLAHAIELIKHKKHPNPVEVEMADRAAIHAHIGTFPKKLFTTKAPREDEDQWKYRKANYRSNTRVHWNRALNSTYRIYNPQNFAIKVNPDVRQFESFKAVDYFFGEYPYFGSLLKWFQQVFHAEKFVDSNAVCVVKPLEIPEDETQLLEPVAKIYESRKVYYCSQDFIMVLTDERSEVTEGNKKKNDGLVFEAYDKEWIYKVVQYGKKSDYKFEVIDWYEHGLGEVPGFKLKGYPVKEGLYKSYFYDAIDALDEALYDYSTLQLGKVDRVFPHKVEVVGKCQHEGCTGGQLYDGMDEDGNKKWRTCPSCQGTGWAGKNGALIATQIDADEFKEGTSVPFPNVAFVSPDVEPLRFLKEQIDGNIENAFTSLNIPFTIDKVSGRETATGRLIDREEFYSFLIHLSRENFGQLDTLMTWIGWMRYRDAYQGQTIVEPREFSIRSASELTDEMEIGRKAGLPDMAIAGLNEQYIQTRFAKDSRDAQLNHIIEQIDTLRHKDVMEINLFVANGSVPKWRVSLHANLFGWILQELAEDEDYLEKPIADIRADMEAKARADIAPSTRVEDLI